VPRLDLHHRIEGSLDRPVVVMSNSLATTMRIWDGQMPALLREHAVIRYDHPGHGSSPRLFGRCTVADLAGDVIAMLDRLGVRRFSFCGLSLGGMVGLHVAAAFPDRVRRLAVCSTSARLDATAFWNERAAVVERDGLDAVAQAATGRWFTPAFARSHPDVVAWAGEMFRSTDPSSYARLAELLADVDLTGTLREIRAPTLVIAGEDDVAIPPAHGEAIASAVPGSSVIRVPDAAHLVNVERPEVVADALARHLADDLAADPQT
jgi:3-oxoadipate enol-lactonase